MEGVFEDPQVKHRKMIVEVSQAGGKTLPVLRNALNMSNYEVSYRAPPRLAEHTRDVLTEWANLDVAQIEALLSTGAVVAL